MQQKIQRKKNSAILIGFAWACISGVMIYFVYNTIDLFTLYVILGLITVTLYFISGFFFKAPVLFLYDVMIYPGGILIAAFLNTLSPKWVFVPNIQNFIISNYFGLLFFYLFLSICGYYLLRSLTGFEVTNQNSIISFNYILKSGEKDHIELLKNHLEKYQDTKLKEKNVDKTKIISFEIEPNRYSIILTPENDSFEVNVLSYKMSSDILCEPDIEEAEVISEIINALFSVWKKQGYVNKWDITESSKFDEKSKKMVMELFSNGKTPFSLQSLEEINFLTTDWLKQNKKAILKYIIVAIISPLFVYLITKLFEQG